MPGHSPGGAHGLGHKAERGSTPLAGGTKGPQRVCPESKANLEHLPCRLALQPAGQRLCLGQPCSVIGPQAWNREWWEEAGQRGREAGGGGVGRKFHSLAHSYQIRERGTRTTSPLQALLCPCFCFGSFPSGLGMALLVGRAGAGAQVPGQLGPRPAPSRAWQAPSAVTRHALLLVREASPSCFQSFITVLFVVQQIKFFWRLEGGGGGAEGERGGRRGRERKYKQLPLGPKD